MRKRTLWVAAAVLLIALVALSAYEFAGTKNQSAAAVLAPPAAQPAATNGPAPTTGATALNQQASSGAAANASLQPALGHGTAGAVAPSLLAAYEGTLEQIYAQVDPSVVNIHVVKEVTSSTGLSGIPRFGPFGRMVPPGPQVQEGLGSGFVWDGAGHIVTNNHVVDGATQISVRFRDGTTVPAKGVGRDVNSDLAVIQVQAPAGELLPVRIADSGQLKVGQLVVAIGNPFGLQGSMSAGIISALGRSLPVDNANSQGPTYSIPDIIQTDAPINPGNSGGVLTDDTGKVVGVTAALESPLGVSAGIGFAIPSAIVQKVVPVLIKAGHYDWPWLGLSGRDLDSNLAKAMGLSADQRGALLGDIVSGGPAEKAGLQDSPAEQAGLQGSQKSVTINGTPQRVGGDVIVALDGQAVTQEQDLQAFLRQSQPSQNALVTILRGGRQLQAVLTLGEPPSVSTT